jgi:hypothetical protein
MVFLFPQKVGKKKKTTTTTTTTLYYNELDISNEIKRIMFHANKTLR